MKKTIFALWLLATLTACADAQPTQPADTHDFVFEVTSDKEAYQTGEDVNIQAMLKYVGNRKEARIFHAASPFTFHIYETSRGVSIPYAMDQPLLSTVMKKDAWHAETYAKSGAIYGDGINMSTFLQDFYEKPGFPAGEYEIYVAADFFIEFKDEKKDYQLTTEKIKIEVTE